MADEVTIIEFDIEYGDGIKETERLTKELIEQRDKVKELGKSHRDLEKVLGSSAESVKKLKKNELEAKDKLSELNRERKKAVDITKIQANSLEGLRKQTKAMFAEREKLNTSTVKGSKRFDELTKKMNENNNKIRQLDRSSGNYATSIGKYPSLIDKAKNSLNVFKKSMLSFDNVMRGTVIAGILVGLNKLRQFIGHIATVNVEFQESIQSLSAITGLVGEDLDKFGDAALNMTKNVRTSAVNIVKAFEMVGSKRPELLKSADALIEVTKAAIILSEATGGKLSLEDAANAVTGSLNQFSLSSDRALLVINALAAGSKEGAANVIQITAAIDQFGAVADNANVPLEESVGLVETLAEKNILGAEAGTKIRNVLLILQKDQNNYKNGVFDLNLALERLNKRSGDTIGLLDEFGKQNVVAATIIGKSIDRYVGLRDAITDTNVAIEQQTKQNNTASAVWDKIINRVTSYFTALEASGFATGSLQVVVEVLIGIERAFLLVTSTALFAFNTVELAIFDILRTAAAGVNFFTSLVGLSFDATVDALDKSSAEFSKRQSENLSEMWRAITGRQKEASKESVEILKKETIAIEEEAAKRVKILSDTELKKIENAADAKEKAIEDEKEAELQRQMDIVEANQEHLDELLEQNKDAAKKELDEKEKLQRDLIRGSQLASNTLFNALGGSLKNEETRINSSYDKRQKALKDQLNAGLITQEQFDKKSKDLERTKAQEIHKIELARHNQKKVQAFVNIAIDIAQAVAKVWAETGLGGIILQSLPIAAGVVQAGIVASQPAPQAPSFKEGGDVKSFMIGGNSHETGGTTFTGSDGSKFVAEKDEGMFITKKGSATLDAIAHINSLNGGRGLNNVSQYYALGGSVITNGTDIDLVEATVESILRNLKIVTQVEDIQTGLDERDAVINVGVI